MTRPPLTLGYIRGAYVEGRTPHLCYVNPQLTSEEAGEQALEEFDEWLSSWDLRVRTETWDSAVNMLSAHNPYQKSNSNESP